MKWSRVILLCIVLLSGLWTVSPPSEGGHWNSEKLSSTNTPETHILIQPNDESFVERNQLVNQGEYYSFENYSLLETWDFSRSSFYSLSPSGHGPPLVRDDHGVYLAFVRKNAWFNYSFMLSFSTNTGYTWSDPMKVRDARGYLNATCSLEKFNGKYYYFMATVDTAGVGSLKVVSSSDVYGLPHATPVTLSNRYSCSELLTISTTGALLAIWKESNSTLFVARNTGGEWNVKRVLNGVSSFTAVEFLGTIRVYYTTPGGGEVRMISSGNNGHNWTSSTTVLNLGREINQISVSSGDGVLHMVANYKKAPLRVMYSRSNDGRNWESPRAIATYNMNYQDPFDDLSIAVKERKITVAFENSSGRISLVNSTDAGGSWVAGPTLGDTHAHSPALDPGGEYLLYCEGEHLVVCLIDRYQYTSYVKTAPLKIPALNLLEDIAVYSPDFRGRISIRIVDQSGTALYPADGMWAVMNRTNRTVDGITVSHACRVSLRASPTVSVEFNFSRDGPYNPHVYLLIINYSTSFPFTYEFNDDTFVVRKENTTTTAGRLHLLPGRNVGGAIIGPIAPDGPWPPLFRISVSGFIRNDMVSVKLLDEYLDPIYGFSENSTNSTVTEDGAKLLSWDGGFLDSLPDCYPVYILIKIKRGNGDPSVGNITISYSKPPEIKSFVSASPAINRTHSLEISALLTDAEDSVESLKVEFRTVDPDGVERDYLSPSFYSSGKWRTVFSPPKDAPTGTYSIYIKAEDPHGNSTGWVPLPGGVLVLNSLPTTPGINVLPERPRSRDNITVTVINPSTDVETDEGNLTYTYRFFKNGQSLKEYLNSNSRSATLPGGLVKKHDQLRIEVTAYDGENESNPAVAIITIENSPPLIYRAPGALTMEEDGVGSALSLPSIFQDLDGDSIRYTAISTEGLSINIEGDTLYIFPEKDFFGNGYVNLTATDGEETTELVIPITVTPVNDPPQWMPLEDRKVLQDEWLTVIINSWDVDGDRVIVENDMTEVVPGLIEGENYLLYPNGSFKIKPDNYMVGTYRIVVTFSDSTVTLQDSFILTILNKDDPPRPPRIETSLSGKYVSAGVPFTLYANCTDPDEIWGQHLTFLWSSSLEGSLGEGRTINVTLKKTGVHVINLTVSDENHTLRASIKISVIGKTVHPAPKDVTLIIISAGSLSLIAGLGVAFLLYKKWISGGEEKTPAEPGTEDTEDHFPEGSGVVKSEGKIN